MDHQAHSLVDALSDAHLVKQWWTGQWPKRGAGFSGPSRPEWAAMDALRDQNGTGLADRQMLCAVLEAQYQEADLPMPGRCAELGRPEVRTVTTGHQLCLATGPAFTWYKVMTTVALAEALEARWGTPVIPVFWMASEDHDFEEVAALWTGRDWHRWEPSAEAVIGGAVGRMHTDGLPEFIREWAAEAGVDTSVADRLAKAGRGTLSSAMRHWMHQWFGPDRIVVIDGDDPQFKAGFAPYLEEEWTQGILDREVTEVNAAMSADGHAPQVHVRPVNLFHMAEGQRDRIVPDGNGGWSAGSRNWPDSNSVSRHMAEDAVSVSPNALMRPLYQSWLLPDVAVVGGLAEVAYWLQLATSYEAFGLSQPALVPRDGGWILSASQQETMAALGVTREALGQGISDWEQHFISRQKPADAGAWRRAILDQEANTLSAFKKLDASLEGSVKATRAKMGKLLDKLEQQARRAVRRQCALDLERLQELHAGLHPAGGGQERTANLWALLSDIEIGNVAGLARILEAGFDRGHDGSMWTPKMHVWTDRPM